MSSELRILVTRPGKIFGAMRQPGDDLTEQFDPAQPDHFQLLKNGVLKLTRVELETTTKKSSRSK